MRGKRADEVYDIRLARGLWPPQGRKREEMPAGHAGKRAPGVFSARCEIQLLRGAYV